MVASVITTILTDLCKLLLWALVFGVPVRHKDWWVILQVNFQRSDEPLLISFLHSSQFPLNFFFFALHCLESYLTWPNTPGTLGNLNAPILTKHSPNLCPHKLYLSKLILHIKVCVLVRSTACVKCVSWGNCMKSDELPRAWSVVTEDYIFF